MIGLEDRQAMARDIDVAHQAGARLQLACEIVGIDARTLQRWKADEGLVGGDGRPQATRPMPGHALSGAERARILQVANEPRFAAVPPARIVPMLADQGVYIASESSFARVLRAHGQSGHRGRARAPRPVRPPTTHIASAPREVWCWEHTDDSNHAAHLVKRTALAEGIAALPIKPVLHGDNGSTLKATTVLAMLNWLGVKPSYSRPRVSDDNAYAESLFRTAKYRPEFPAKGFDDLDAVRKWALTLCVDTTTITGTAASAMSLQRSAMPARITRSWLHVMRCTRGHGSATRPDGHEIHETGRRCALLHSTRNATASSTRIRTASINSRWLHE